MRTYHFDAVSDARESGVDQDGIALIVEQIRTYRQTIDAGRARRKKIRFAARLARRAGRS